MDHKTRKGPELVCIARRRMPYFLVTVLFLFASYAAIDLATSSFPVDSIRDVIIVFGLIVCPPGALLFLSGLIDPRPGIVIHKYGVTFRAVWFYEEFMHVNEIESVCLERKDGHDSLLIFLVDFEQYQGRQSLIRRVWRWLALGKMRNGVIVIPPAATRARMDSVLNIIEGTLDNKNLAPDVDGNRRIK